MDSESSLPNYSKFSSFCGPRIREIKALENDLNNCEHGLRAFQKLPRNMQRRNVSYNPQRLPRYLREKHKREIGNKIKVNKRPCRKYRRRPANLLSEYNRRQRDNVWLESHIWHAKRYHMIKQWGYVLPKTPTFKAFRATVRAATESCMIQDVSFECCLEIESSSPSEMHERLSSLMPPNEAKKVFDSDTIKGCKWIETTLYKPQKFPFGFIGDAQIICSSQSWKNSYKLWMWVHPSVFEDVLSTLIDVFDLTLIPKDDIEAETFKPVDHVTYAKLLTKNIPVQKAPSYMSDSIKLNVLKDTLVKFRLIGPGSYSLLKRILVPSEVLRNNNNNDKECESLPNSDDHWWVSFFSNPDHIAKHEKQLLLWNSLKKNYTLSKKVISLVVRDVRAVLPTKKRPFEYEENTEPLSEEVYSSESLYPVFDSDIRESLIRNMKSNHEMTKVREKILVPGTPLPLTDEESRVPVMLLQRPGSHVSGFGAGWDLILPCGWSTQTLTNCVMNGAVVGGQAEEETLMKEFLTHPRPYYFPDTNAGTLYAQQQKQERENEYFKRPPNSRHNFIKLGIKFPFGIDWMELMKNWNSSCEDFYVVRDKSYLNYLYTLSCKKILKIADKRSLKRKATEGEEKVLPEDKRSLKRKATEGEEKVLPEKILKTSEAAAPVKTEKAIAFFMIEEAAVPLNASLSLKMLSKDKTIQSVISDLKNSLLYVRLIILGKGSAEPFATVCLPTEDDLRSVSEHGNGAEVVEPFHEDLNSKKRSELKAKHKTQLNNLRRKRKKARNEVLCCKENPIEEHKTMQDALKAAVDVVNKENTEVIKNVESYASNYNKLWLQNTEEPFQSNARKIIGFLTHTGYCLRMGRSGGLGYVVTEALINHMDKLNMFDEKEISILKNPDTLGATGWPKQILVLTRNPTCFQYKWARLVILNV